MKILYKLLLITLLIANQVIAQQAKNIKGKILSTSNEPIEGVTVVVDNKSYYDISDIDGNFNISRNNFV